MIVAIITYKLAKPLTKDEAREIFNSTSVKYTGISDLIRKYYLIDEGGMQVGGVYLWKSRVAAEMTFNDEWRRHILKTYGTTPSIEYFDCPVVVDNLTREVINK